MFFKRSKVDKSKAAAEAPDAAPAAQSAEAAEAPPVAAAPAEPVEPALPLGAHTKSSGQTDPLRLGVKPPADLQPAA
jgi:hypothetical protein